ncbi:cellulase, partial [Kineococcus sp. T90]|nr:cellulase [Kineococcus indalonis]
MLDKLGITDPDDEASEDSTTDSEDEVGGSTDDAQERTDVMALPAGTNHTTLTAEGFVDSVGVGTHVAYLDTSYGQVDTVALLKELGVKHVRDGLGSNDSAPIATLKEIGQAGIGINWVAQPEDSSFSIDAQLQLMKDHDLNVESVEGANERDNHGDAAWAGKVRRHQAQLYEKVKTTLGDDVAVVAPSLVHDGSREELGEVPSDVANAHPYTGGHMQTAEQTEHQMRLTRKVTPSVDTAAPQQAEADERVTLTAAVEDSGALYATELGFHTGTDSTAGRGVQPHVSEDAQATLQLQQLLENYRNGVDRSYVYELLDEGEDESEAEDRFGLVHSDGSPKPVFTALKNLLSVVKGSTSTSSGTSSGAAGARALGVQVQGGGGATTS